MATAAKTAAAVDDNNQGARGVCLQLKLAHLRKGDWLQITSKTVQKLKLHKHFILSENLVSLILQHPVVTYENTHL